MSSRFFMPNTTISQMTDAGLNQDQTQNDKISRLLKQKRVAREFVERRYMEWTDNYELYRNRPKTNRLTQRQAVNIPLMKETLKTLLSKIDEAPTIEWKELGGDEQKELIMQELWNHDYERCNLEAVDIQDKKSVLLYGRAFKKLNWRDGQFEVQALDIYDVVVDPLVDPVDLETARYVIHQNIFRSLEEILNDERYTKEGKDKLRVYLSTKEGMVQTSKNYQEWEKKMVRIKDMGLDSTRYQRWASGDVIVNLNEHHYNEWNGKEWERRVCIYADDRVPLMDETIEEVMGIDFYPFITWGEDIETQDFWSDAPADLVRVPNKIMNIWYSQLVENRTLQNFQMHWFLPVQGYQPQTYEPGPGRMLPAPPGDDIRKVIQPVQIDGLDDTFNALEFVKQMVESGTAATAITKGEEPETPTTLGQTQLMLGAANERTMSISKFYRRAWQDFAVKWERIVDANSSKKVVLYKSSPQGKIYPKTVYTTDWRSKDGYKVLVRSTSEQEQSSTKSIQKFLFVQQQFPNNKALTKIAQRRELEILDLSPVELRQIEDEEEQNQQMAMAQPIQQPQQPQLPQQQAPLQTKPAMT